MLVRVAVPVPAYTYMIAYAPCNTQKAPAGARGCFVLVCGCFVLVRVAVPVPGSPWCLLAALLTVLYAVLFH